MSKKLVFMSVVLLGLAWWTYKGVQTFQAYEFAVSELGRREAIREALGDYEISYDWWFGVFRALRHGEIQEFEFHLTGQRDNAISVVNLRKNAGWEITCINVVNGEYLNNRIVHDC